MSMARFAPLVLGLLLVVAVAADVGGWWVRNLPQPAGPDLGGPMRSASFAPFRDGQSPLTQIYPTRGQIDEDLARLRGLVRGVRTYTSREGMQAVPELASKYGLKVIHSAWLTSDATELGRAGNTAETDALIAAANAHPETIERVIVGNEVLLRRDLKPDQLIAYIRKVKQAVKQPVSYADVWAFYLKNPEVAREVDFLTIHILPYWEDEPVGIDHVAEHIVKIVRIMQQAFPGKPILIGESGWPSAGRQRGPAVPGVVNAATYLRRLVTVAGANNFDYNVVEAFDQSWKAKLEGTVGANWGVVSLDRVPRFPLSGPVTEDPAWPPHAAAAALLGVLLVAPVLGRLRRAPPWAALAVMLAAQAMAAALVAYGLAGWTLGFTLWGKSVASLTAQRVLTTVAMAVLVPFALLVTENAAGLAVGEGDRGGNATTWVQALGRLARRRALHGAPLAEGLFALLTAYALVQTAAIVLDGRYRDIPVLPFAAPVIGIVSLALLRLARGRGFWAAIAYGPLFGGGGGPAGSARGDRRMATLLTVAAVANIIAEGFAIVGEDFAITHTTLAEQAPLVLWAMVGNGQVLTWSAMLVALALPFWANARRAARPQVVKGRVIELIG